MTPITTEGAGEKEGRERKATTGRKKAQITQREGEIQFLQERTKAELKKRAFPEKARDRVSNPAKEMRPSSCSVFCNHALSAKDIQTSGT